MNMKLRGKIITLCLLPIIVMMAFGLMAVSQQIQVVSENEGLERLT